MRRSELELTSAIVTHILINLGLFTDATKSINNASFLLEDTISYLDEDKGLDLQAPIYACETKIDKDKLTIIYTSFDFEKEQEIFAIIKLDNNPVYGLYLNYDIENKMGTDGFIGTELKGKSFIPASFFIQGMFLSGMETLRDVILSYDAVSNPTEALSLLKTFIKYREGL